MAKQLYDYWFIQFDFPNEEGKPYKSSGGKMVWNEKLKREIPDGWDCKTIKELIKVSKETITPSDNPLKLYRHYSIPAFDQFHSYSSELGETIFSDKFIVEPNMLMVSKLNPWTCRTLLSMDYDNQICSTEYVCMKENVKETNGFLFYLTKSEKFISYCTQGATGTSHSHRRVNPDFMINFKFAYNDETIRRFSQHVLYSIKKTNDNIEIIRNLTKQRDELLPLLMNGQVSVNSDLSKLTYIIEVLIIIFMKNSIIQTITNAMQRDLDYKQMARLKEVLNYELSNVEISERKDNEANRELENGKILSSFIAAKKIEGCSDKTLLYYRNTIDKMLSVLQIAICHIETCSIRSYLSKYQEQNKSSKVTIDNMRRIFSSFFAWLEDEDYIAKSPVRRIHKVKTDSLVKEVLSDEQLELLRDNCTEKRDLAIIDLLSSTGIRVGELVKLNRSDIDFHERQCVVFGKGNKERTVYFNARTKIHIDEYISSRTDDNEALFVSLKSPYTRLSISGVEVRMKGLGKQVQIPKVHPHKFRRTLATMAIDKGMPIEQVQKLLGHVRIDTTLHYAMVNQNNVKMAHRKYLG